MITLTYSSPPSSTSNAVVGLFFEFQVRSQYLPGGQGQRELAASLQVCNFDFSTPDIYGSSVLEVWVIESDGSGSVMWFRRLGLIRFDYGSR